MKQEDKQLLLQDLCARLPYRVKCIIEGLDDCTLMPSDIEEEREIKPYLRPMSSMTEDEIEELKELCSIYLPCDKPMMFEDYGIIVFTHHIIHDSYSFKFDSKVVDWLLAHHFDFRCLIEKGLAIEVTEENNPYKD